MTTAAYLVPNAVLQPKQLAFIAAYAQCGIISIAAEAAGVHRTMYNYWCEHDDQFKAAVTEAQLIAAEKLEAHARQWATIGIPTVKEVYERDKNGEMVLVSRTMERSISPTLLIFTLKALFPDKYRENLLVTTRDERQKVLDSAAWEAI